MSVVDGSSTKARSRETKSTTTTTTTSTSKPTARITTRTTQASITTTSASAIPQSATTTSISTPHLSTATQFYITTTAALHRTAHRKDDEFLVIRTQDPVNDRQDDGVDDAFTHYNYKYHPKHHRGVTVITISIRPRPANRITAPRRCPSHPVTGISTNKYPTSSSPSGNTTTTTSSSPSSFAKLPLLHDNGIESNPSLISNDDETTTRRLHQTDKVTINDFASTNRRPKTIPIVVVVILLVRLNPLLVQALTNASSPKTKPKSKSTKSTAHQSSPIYNNYYAAQQQLSTNQSGILFWITTTTTTTTTATNLNANTTESISKSTSTDTAFHIDHRHHRLMLAAGPLDTQHQLTMMLLNRNLSAFFRQCLPLVVLVLMAACAPVIAASFNNVKYSRHTVKTKYGPLRGIMVRSNPPVEAYLGVPYATPPVGSLRYMPPVTPSTWRNTRLADQFSPVCPQLSPIPDNDEEARFEIPRGRLSQLRRLVPLLVNQSEDCLYLNLYVPRSDHSAKTPLAAVVYIHGESFEWNSGNTYDGSVLAGLGNVIVVTVNFRLGVLGFLKTGSKGSAQGNFGLMDLVAGLHWLRENIPAFNGDATRITVMGHSTGAALANILIVSPVSSDLIHRAILLSGSAMSPWSIQRDPLHVKRKVAEHTGCHGDLLEDDMAPCLRSKSVSELLTVKIDSPRFLPGFAPFVDGTVILNSVRSIPLTLPSGSAIASTSDIELADFPTKALLFALTSTESYLDLNAQDLEYGFNETRRDRIFRTYVRNVYRFHLNEIFSTLKNEYTDWERPPRNPMGPRDATMEFLSDGHTAAPLVRLAYLHSLRGGLSYFMHFKHESGDRDFPQRFGSVRGEDIPFFFGLPVINNPSHNYSRKDVQISRTLLQYVANFVRQGNPNETPSATSYVDTYAYDYIESPVEGVVNHQQQQVLTGNGAESSNHKRKRQTASNHRSTNNNNNNNSNNKRKRNHGSGIGSGSSASDDSDEFDGGDEYDSVEKPSESAMKTVSSSKQQRPPDEIWRKPFWDTYDSINQLYLEISNKLEIRNHYRGHKLSMWLSLIPQLHNPGDLADLSMRHHHFSEESAQFYDGIVRPQLLQPTAYKSPTNAMSRTTTTSSKVDLISSAVLPADIPRTECAPNTTIVTTIAATHHIQSTQPQTYSVAATNNNVPQKSPPNNHPQSTTTLVQQTAATTTTSNNNLLRRLLDSQFHNFTTGLVVIIVVGCTMLLVNVLVFAGIYYQRGKQVNDSIKKEELTTNTTNSTSETDGLKSSCPSIHEKCGGVGGGGGEGGSSGLMGGIGGMLLADRKHSLQSISDLNLSEFAFYEDNKIAAHCLRSAEKKSPHLHRHSHHPHSDMCHLDLSVNEFKCGIRREGGTPAPSSSGGTYSKNGRLSSMPAAHRHSMEVPSDELYNNPIKHQPHNHHHSSHHSLQVTLPRYSPYLGSTMRLNQKPAKEQCNQSTQSDIPDVQDVGTGAMDNDLDIIQCHSSRSTENVRASCDASTLTSPPGLLATAPLMPRGGILRQSSAGGGGATSTSATPTASKKRVHIQEISV